MNLVRVKVSGKFDRAGWQEIANSVVPLPGEVPVRWQVRILWFTVTIVGKVELESVDLGDPS